MNILIRLADSKVVLTLKSDQNQADLKWGGGGGGGRLSKRGALTRGGAFIEI